MSDRDRWFTPLILVGAVILAVVAVAIVIVVAANNLDGTDLKSGVTTATVLLIGVIGLLSVIAVLVMLFRRYDDPKGARHNTPRQRGRPNVATQRGGSQGATQEDKDDRERQPLWALLSVFALILVNISVAALIVYSVKRLKVLGFTPEITTATVLVIGVIGLLGAVAVLVAVFHHYGVESATGALGLPDGSVQAVIALALLLIFALFGVYLHGSAGSPEVRRSSCLSAAQVEVIPDGTIVRVQSKRYRRGSKCLKPPPKAKVTKARPNANARQRRRARRATARSARAAARSTVVRYRVAVAVPNVERQNITTQLLSTIGTLVVAVAGFYFGAKAVQAGVKRAGDAAGRGAELALTGIPGVGRGRGRGDDGAKGVTARPRGPNGGGAGEASEASLYGSHSAAGLSGADVREELQSTPLAAEDEGEESLREQRAEKPEDAEPDDDDFDEPAEEGEDEASYGTASPVIPGVTAADLHDELGSAPLTEEDDAEESVDEQGVADEEPAEEDEGEPSEEADAEDEAAYGTTSPLTPGLTASHLHDEMESSPLAEEDEAEESLREQGLDESSDAEPEAEDEAEDSDEEPVEEKDETESAEEPEPKPAPEDEEPPEKV